MARKKKEVAEPLGQLEGKVVLIRKEYLKREFQEEKNWYFLCQSGFGCSPTSLGSKVFGFYLNDGEETHIRREHVEKVVPITEVFQKRIDEIKARIDYRDNHCCICKEEITSGTRHYNIFTKEVTCQKCIEANKSADSASL